MFLKEIYLKNYKCFEEKTLSFDKRFTVLIGDNGSGKTAALDGIARGLAQFVGDFQLGVSEMSLDQNEIRHVNVERGSKISIELVTPLSINTTIKYLEEVYNWSLQVNDNISGSLMSSNSIGNFTYKLKKKDSLLPIFIYYPTTRHYSNTRFEDVDLYPLGSRYKVYSDCLNPDISSKTLQGWFKRMTFIEIQEKTTPPELKAVSMAVQKAIEKLRNKESKIFFDVKSDELIITIGDGKELPFRLLSEGYRNTLGLIADIAYRMAELNPHVTTDTPGVVLIDEIDLHLHPKWQRNIVGDLKRIFPNCQFIVTTHSPFIIQSLDVDDGIIRLDNEYEEVPEDFVNQSIEDIVEDMQGVENPQWSRKKSEMYEAAKRYFEVLEKMNSQKDAAEIQRLREELELLKKPYASNVAYLAFLEQKRLVKEAQLQKEALVVNDPEPQTTYKKTNQQ